MRIMGWWRCGAAPSKMVKIIIRKPRQNLSWKEFYYNVARCEKCPGCQKLSSRLKWALGEDSLAHLLLHKVESATITPNMGSGGCWCVTPTEMGKCFIGLIFCLLTVCSFLCFVVVNKWCGQGTWQNVCTFYLLAASVAADAFDCKDETGLVSAGIVKKQVETVCHHGSCA